MYRYQPLLFQPLPSLLGYPVSDLVEEVRARLFPEIGRVEVRYASEGPLAFIASNFMGHDRHMVAFHPVLNHPGTPRPVLEFIAKHELTHLVHPPARENGWLMHPEEFWAHEATIGPERDAAWAWIQANLGRCMRHLPSGLRVTTQWRRLRETSRLPYTPTLPFEAERFARLCPSEAQLRLPPDWAALPLPLRA